MKDRDVVDERFTSQMAKHLVGSEIAAKDYNSLGEFPLHDKQGLYVFDWKKGGVVYERGIKKLLGYTGDELYFEDLINGVHPEDRYFVEHITKEAVKHTFTNKPGKTNTRLFITYRFRKKNGSYIRLMRQTSSFEFDGKGAMLTNISILTDISFMGMGGAVSWDLQSDGLDQKVFEEKIYGVYRKVFTLREREVISLIAKGLKNFQIAENLCISQHTVSTHRKKIFRKAGVSNAADLLVFCRKNGITD